MLWAEKMLRYDIACRVRDGKTTPTVAAVFLHMTLDEFHGYYRSRFGAMA